MSLFENLERAWEMTVLPQPKAPGIAVVPPCTHLYRVVSNAISRIGYGNAREKGIQNPLTSEQREIRSVLFRDWSRRTNGPNLHHGVFCGLALKLGLQHDVLNNIEA